MLCSLAGLVADADKADVEVSSCSLFTTLSLLLSTTPVMGKKVNGSALRKSTTTHPCDTAKCQRKNHVRPHLLDFPLINNILLRDFTSTIRKKMRCLCVEFIQCKVVYFLKKYFACSHDYRSSYFLRKLANKTFR